jgi:general secretion pathway protein D
MNHLSHIRHQTSCNSNPAPRFLLFLALFLFTISEAPGQFGPGGFGGAQQGGGANANRSRTTTRTYSAPGAVGDAVISIDPETRSLIVIADERTREYISQVVSNLDKPKPQVLIKVVFVEVTHNKASDIGIEGAYRQNIGDPIVTGFMTNFQVINAGMTNAAIVPSSITPITSSLSASNIFGLGNAGSPAGLYQIFSQDYQVTLRAIAQTGQAKVLSRPSVIARNNQPATITVGQSVPLINAVRFDNFGNQINSVQYTSVGIILRVTPFITSEGLVEMILAPETSELVADRSQWVPISTGIGGTVSAPLINSRLADTVVVTPNGQTVVIGGLMQDSKADTVSKIPFLGDIPMLGYLFRRTIKSNARTELIIFLTPHIIQAPTEVAAVTESERTKSDAASGLTEQELNKFLDSLPTKEPETRPKK